MNYYAFHIGDYASATQHLTDLEDLAYRRMMDLYYVTERRLPLDRRQLYRLLRANSEAMREAVDVVISEFFTEDEDGWSHGRCDAEIEKARAKSDKAKANGKLGGVAKAKRLPEEELANGKQEKVATAKRSLDAGLADATIEASKGLAPKTKTKTNVCDVGLSRPRDPPENLEARLREAAGWQSEPAPMLCVTGEIEALINSGADLDADVLPVIKALSPRAEASSWRYFTKAIARARDQRIAALQDVVTSIKPRDFNASANRSKPTREEAFAAIERRIAEVADAERREADGGQDCFVEPHEGAA